eukprot:gene1050-377_t
MYGMFLFLYIVFTATTSNLLLLTATDSTTAGVNASPPVRPPTLHDSQTDGDDDNQHTVHLMEVWTKDAGDAYTIAPMLLRTGSYNNALRVRWYWNKHCIGKHITLYVCMDDAKYFRKNPTKRPELEWLKAWLGTYMDKVFMLLFHSYPAQNSEHVAHLDQHS